MNILNNNNNDISNEMIETSENRVLYGRLNEPSCFSVFKGACGDVMEYYLIIENNVITDVKFNTTGCASSKACGLTLAEFIINKDINEAISVSPQYIINKLKYFPNDFHHCAILACITFYKAIGEYLVNSNS
jgi:nitrogen fixation NifU-like protein